MTHEPHNVRRANPRFPFFADADVVLRDGTCIPAQLDELSERGCFIKTIEPIPIHTKFRLHIEYVGGIFELDGKIIYMQSGGGLGLFGAGVVFENVTTDQHTAINAWLNNPAYRSRQLK